MDISANLTSQIKDDYLAYSMAVLIGRAIPSLTDGMKPVQRRILAAMRNLGLKPDGRYMKSARVEGEVAVPPLAGRVDTGRRRLAAATHRRTGAPARW